MNFEEGQDIIKKAREVAVSYENQSAIVELCKVVEKLVNELIGKKTNTSLEELRSYRNGRGLAEVEKTRRETGTALQKIGEAVIDLFGQTPEAEKLYNTILDTIGNAASNPEKK